MTAGNRTRTAVGMVALALLAGVAAVHGQLPEPGRMPPVPTEKLPNLRLPGEPGEDPDVIPAQFTRPAAPVQPPTTPAPPRPVADPPAAVVRIQVRVPADSPPGDDLRYTITVTNVSPADAHQVKVRNPVPPTAEFLKAEPAADTKTPGQIVWSLGTLRAGESKKVELVLRHKPNEPEVKNLAYVSFEYGEQVTTRISKPTLKVTKTAPKQALRDEPFTVRVVVENTAPVPVEKVRVVENLADTVKFEAVTTGAKRTGPPAANQREWEIPRLMPGERRVFEYKVTPTQGAEVVTQTVASNAKGVQESKEARTAVLVPGLAVTLKGPDKVDPGEAGEYELVVRNTGTLPGANVRVTGGIPAGCKVTRKTEGGQVGPTQVNWLVPRLDAGEARSFRFVLRADGGGPRAVTASATDGRRLQAKAAEVSTYFLAAAALVWETAPEPSVLPAGRQGKYVVTVRNGGGAAAANVRVEVELPDAVAYTRSEPAGSAAGRKVAFGPDTVPAGGERTYTVTFEGRQASQAVFRAKLSADALGDRPLTSDKTVTVTGGTR